MITGIQMFNNQRSIPIAIGINVQVKKNSLPLLLPTFQSKSSDHHPLPLAYCSPCLPAGSLPIAPCLLPPPSLKLQRASIAHCLLPIATLLLVASCSIQKQITRSAQKVINDSSLLNAHTGISIFEPSAGKYWFNFQGDKYFVPASNTKIPTCYAAMKYLGDRLVGLKVVETEHQLFINGSGDPSFLHPDF